MGSMWIYVFPFWRCQQQQQPSSELGAVVEAWTLSALFNNQYADLILTLKVVLYLSQHRQPRAAHFFKRRGLEATLSQNATWHDLRYGDQPGYISGGNVCPPILTKENTTTSNQFRLSENFQMHIDVRSSNIED